MSYLPQQRAIEGWWDSVKKIGGEAVKGAINVYGESQKQAGMTEAYKAQVEAQATAQQPRATPSWVLPAAVGGGALILILVMRRK